MSGVCPICGDKLRRGISRRHDQLHQLHTGRQRIVHQVVDACISCPYTRAVGAAFGGDPALAGRLPLLRDLVQARTRGQREMDEEKVGLVIEGRRVRNQDGYSGFMTWLSENHIAESSWYRWLKIYRENDPAPPRRGQRRQ